jgi:hypothetical protein
MGKVLYFIRTVMNEFFIMENHVNTLVNEMHVNLYIVN